MVNPVKFYNFKAFSVGFQRREGPLRVLVL